MRTEISFSFYPAFNPGHQMWRREGASKQGIYFFDRTDGGCYGARAGVGINYDKWNKPRRTKGRDWAVYYLKIRNKK